jgi:hypothetical protein
LTFQQSTSARAGSLRLAVSGVKHRFSALCLDALARRANLRHKEGNKPIIMAKTKIPSKTLTELNRQLNCELTAAQAYLALSVWCCDRNLKGFASFFSKQSGEEREHAEKFMKHVHDRGVAPELAAIAAPKQNFKSLLEVVEQAQAMEQANTRGINSVYERPWRPGIIPPRC